MAAYGGPGGQRPGGQGGPGGPGGHRPDGPDGDDFGPPGLGKICGNSTVLQSFVTQLQQLFTTLQSNGSFTQVLADRAQEVAYIQSATNAALIATNSTA